MQAQTPNKNQERGLLGSPREPSKPREFWIDRGGTFTDCIGYDPTTGELAVIKVLSSDDAPLEGIRRLLGLAEGTPIPPCEVRLGTTLATNALLEHKGVRCALAITRGFGDLLAIGDQTREDLFALDIRKTEPLCEEVIEVDARASVDGSPLVQPDAEALTAAFSRLAGRGVRSLAAVVMHDHVEGKLERQLSAAAQRAGIEYFALGSDQSREAGLLARTETAVLDAYLTPLLQGYVAHLAEHLPGSRLRFMQSSGGLTSAAHFRGPSAILSGPAGGVVASARIAERLGTPRVIGFDMGGTSTDVCRYDGEYELTFERRIAGQLVRAPSLAVHTVAAGGGSVCRFDGYKLCVGPDSAGADPGPLCYGRSHARELTISDVNLLLGRVIPDTFPFALDLERPRLALDELRAELARRGHQYGLEELGAGFLEIADQHMAEAIREISVAKGYDVRDYALSVFGGAGGQHACSVARRLGVTTILFHPLSGVLSAYGIGQAEPAVHRERELRGVTLQEGSLDELEPLFAVLEDEGRSELELESNVGALVSATRFVDLCYAGTETRLTVRLAPFAELGREFEQRHERAYGHRRSDHPIEVVALRVESVLRKERIAPKLRADERARRSERSARVFLRGRWHDEVPLYERAELAAGVTLSGPALIAETTGTIVLEPGFSLRLAEDGILIATLESSAALAAEGSFASAQADPLALEIMSHAFMAIAEQMGQALRRTAVSTNIRERLDFSCAIFDRAGGLVANAPHIPVHLGAMSESVRAVLAAHPELAPGDAFVTNDPAGGGSHLPDITVVMPVHDASHELRFFVATRGHHADIGGITPGSMPAFSRTLEEEGVVLPALTLVRGERLLADEILAALASARYPARRPRENLGDLEAQLAAARTGAELLGELMQRRGVKLVERYMQFVQDDAAERVRSAFAELGETRREFSDALDDGTPIRVALELSAGKLCIDFSGSGAEQDGNLNAPRAVTVAAVLYFLRTLVGHPIPLNGGCLRHVELIVPSPSVLWPSAGRAVAGGNVETSQRVVDVLLAAAGRAAASQGTMNNLSFGNERFGYYETIAGGSGAGPGFHGASAVHTHMTNTRITDPEILERRFPVRLLEFSVRRGSGGGGRFRGGDGLCRELEFLEELEVSLLSERRTRRPFGLLGGLPGEAGRALLDGEELPAKFTRRVRIGSRLRIETPGGGGFGEA